MYALIDTSGKVWDAHSGALRLQFNAPISSAALPNYLLRNLGFLGVKVDGDSASIKAAPGRISYPAFSVMIKLVAFDDMRRIALQWFDGRWHDEVFFGVQSGRAIPRFLELMLQHRQQAPSYLSYPRELATIARGHKLSPLLSFWKDRHGEVDPMRDAEQLYRHTDGKFLTIGRMANNRLRFTSIGRGLSVYRDNSWAVQFSGGPVEEQPDYRFGLFMLAGYHDAFTDKAPSAMDFDTIVRDARNGNAQHHRYTRLLLPIRTETGEIELLSAPRADASMELSVERL